MTPLEVVHETRYRYGAPVELAHHAAFLRPLEDEQQRVDAFEMRIEPIPSQHSTGRDAFGNSRAFFAITTRHELLTVTARSKVRVAPRADAIEPAASPPWQAVAERLRYVAGAPYRPEAQFCAPSPYVPRLRELADYAAPSFAAERPLADAAIELMHRLHADFRYEPDSTDVQTPLADAFVHRAGVCQDFSHLMLGALRGRGLAARYVSGYLLTVPPDGAALDGAGPPRAGEGPLGGQRGAEAAERRGTTLVGSDASHAWIALWCPDTPGLTGGWLELDPTNDCLPSLPPVRHVRLAIGRDYGDVTPLRGVIRGGGTHALEVRVSTTLCDAG